MKAATTTVWLGRVTQRGDPREYVVRIHTEGRAPVPTDPVEDIEDPFEAVDPRRGGGARGDAAVLARTLPVKGEIRGALGQFSLAPPVRPSKIIGVGRNYRAHAEEMGNEIPEAPLLFFKPSSALIASGQPIELLTTGRRIDYEGELVVVVGRRARKISAQDAWSYIAGYTLGNDVSDRIWQKEDRQWTRAKGADTFAPLGPWIRLLGANPVPLNPEIRVQTFVDDALRQDGEVGAMIRPVPVIVEYVAACMTLEPGDLIYTGTPRGVGPLAPDNVVRVEARGLDLGQLTNPVVCAQD